MENKRKFLKFEAAGNDFILISISQALNWGEWPQKVSKLCQRHSGVGADGVIFLWKEKSIWTWKLFNSDGSTMRICGNGARCVAEFLYQQEYQEKGQENFYWQGEIGQVHARRMKNEEWAVHWKALSVPEDVEGKVSDLLLEDLSCLNDRGFAAAIFLDVGLPHLVLVNHENWGASERHAHGKFLREHPCFRPEGTNVTWLSLKSMKCVTFERGIESETLSCGSGALAAYVAMEKHKDKRKNLGSLTFYFPGGNLSIFRESIEDEKEALWLQGSAHLVFKGEILFL